MSKTQHETGPEGELVCPACKHPVDTVIKRRHKTLGVFVPVWEPGPCRNPDCPEYSDYPKHARPDRHA
ncbi:hypothetical protein ACH44C_27290 [Streptomyces purpureus]|uniref:hypothetical protein n=1 Tax=Streptomyces purpureus TaxID=1951 RepID=UPI0009987296|nr:hypothetical protein [Streptomyces purpureus]